MYVWLPVKSVCMHKFFIINTRRHRCQKGFIYFQLTPAKCYTWMLRFVPFTLTRTLSATKNVEGKWNSNFSPYFFFFWYFAYFLYCLSLWKNSTVAKFFCFFFSHPHPIILQTKSKQKKDGWLKKMKGKSFRFVEQTQTCLAWLIWANIYIGFHSKRCHIHQPQKCDCQRWTWSTGGIGRIF